MKKEYYKLVRDRIPEIIDSTGGRCKTRTLAEQEYVRMLNEKLQEELNEYLESGSVEELADLLEVMMAAAKAAGNDWQTVEAIRQEKYLARGGFVDRILLLEVTEK